MSSRMLSEARRRCRTWSSGAESTTVTRPKFSSGHTIRRTVCARRLRRTCARIHKLGPDRVRTRPLSRRKDPARSASGGAASTPEVAAHGIDSGEMNLTARSCGHVCLALRANGFPWRSRLAASWKRPHERHSPLSSADSIDVEIGLAGGFNGRRDFSDHSRWALLERKSCFGPDVGLFVRTGTH